MLTETENLALKSRTGFHRAAGLPTVANLDPTALPWGDLTKVQRAAQTEARLLVDKAEARNINTEEMAKLETAIDLLTEIAEAMSAEKDERTAAGSREPRDGIDTSRRPLLTGETRGVDDGASGDVETASRILGRDTAQRDQFVRHAQVRNAHEFRGLSLGRYLRSMAVGGKTETERRALSEGSDSAGGHTVPEYLGGALIDALRAQSVCVAAGAQTWPLDTANNVVAKLASDPTPGWRDELAAVAESDPTFAPVNLTPQSLAVKCSVSLELLNDSVNLEAELPRVLSAAMATELDRVALLGSGSAPEPLGVANQSGIGTTALGGPLTGYQQFVSARTGVLTANAGPVSAILLHPRDEGTLTGFTDGNGQPLTAPKAIEAIPMLTTTAIPVDGGVGSDESTVFVGNFAHLILGIRQDIRIDVLRHTLANDLSYTFVAHMRADVAVQHAAAFHTVTGVQGQ